jgi:hypothetical protein
MFQPTIFKLPKVDAINMSHITSNSNIFNSVPPYPLSSLGYHQYITRTRETLITKLKSITTDKQIFFVVNPGEITISNYEEDIVASSGKYLKIDNVDVQKIILWELLYIYNIYGSNCITSEDIEDVISMFGEKIGKKGIKLYSKEKEIEKLKLNSCDAIILFNKNINDEPNSINDIINNIIKILSYQSDGGTSVLQISDTFTYNTLNLIYILASFFEECYVYKPFTSKPYETDKYLILSKFKTNKNQKDIVSQLEKSIAPKNEFHICLFPNLTLSNDFINTFKYINTKIVNTQQIYINDIITFIKGNDYFGDDYHKYKTYQLNFTKWWIMTFYPPSVNIYNKNKEELGTLFKSAYEKNKLECSKFLENIF